MGRRCRGLFGEDRLQARPGVSPPDALIVPPAAAPAPTETSTGNSRGFRESSSTPVRTCAPTQVLDSMSDAGTKAHDRPEGIDYSFGRGWVGDGMSKSR
jgi:hypothetical protein